MNGAGRTGFGAALADIAKFLDAITLWLIMSEWHVGKNLAQADAGSKLRRNQHRMPAIFAKTRLNGIGYYLRRIIQLGNGAVAHCLNKRTNRLHSVGVLRITISNRSPRRCRRIGLDKIVVHGGANNDRVHQPFWQVRRFLRIVVGVIPVTVMPARIR